jgi:L,D-peptidoglycan transpeptidase YkuD (ErfK/YbiS/YcfS/YnhG family)
VRLCLLVLFAACSAEKKAPEAGEPRRVSERETTPLADRRDAHQAAVRDTPIPAESRQLILAVVPGWDEVKAEVTRFERGDDGTWKQVGESWPAVIGVSGAAWGRGLHGAAAPAGQDGPVKVEGDGRSPAGVFALGSAYGYGAAPPGVKLPYTVVDRDWLCIDDARSAYYNKVLDTGGLAKDWTSSEVMRRSDELYRRVIVIDHNPEPTPGGGSCIFLHLWHGADGGGTAGCTAMAPESMEGLLGWIDPAVKPVFVLLPRDRLAALRGPWGLP